MEREKREKEDEKRAEKLFEIVVANAKLDKAKAYEEFGVDIVKKFGTMYGAFEESARRIVYGKCANSGQTCVAPDYALVPEASVDAFIDACRAAVKAYYPTLAGNPQFTGFRIDERPESHALHDAPDDDGALPAPVSHKTLLNFAAI
jgi:hypothetical protein